MNLRLLPPLPRLAPVALLLAGSSCASPSPKPTVDPSDPPASSEPNASPLAEAAASRPSPADPPSAGALSAADRPAARFIEADPSAAPERLPQVKITSPRRDAEIPASKAASTEVKITVRDWELSAGGSHLRAVLDGRPAVRLFDLTSRLTLGDLSPDGPLADGQHVLVVLPARASGESVKPSGTHQPAAFVSFFVGKKREVKSPWKESSPLLVLSSPGREPVNESAVLLDFYVLNAPIAEGKYVVHAAVSGPTLQVGESLSSWKPYRVANAQAGAYIAQFSLFHYAPELGDSSSSTTVRYTSQPVKGPFVEVRREFRVDGSSR